MVFKVAYDAGHGKNTAGKRSPSGITEEREWYFNDTVARAFAKELSTYKGVELLRMDDASGQRDVPLYERTNKANSANADLYVSFHHNAYKSIWGDHTGVETYYYKVNEVGRKLAEDIQKAIVGAYGLRDRGIKTNNLHITRETKMTAILIEGGFMDSRIDIKKLRDKKVLESAGKAVAEVVAEYAGLTKDSTEKPVEPPKSNVKPTPNKPTKKIAEDGFFGNETARKAQEVYGMKIVDGVISGQPNNANTRNIPSAKITYGKNQTGSNLIYAMQKEFDVPVKYRDGKITYPSMLITNMQKYYGTPQDSLVSYPSMVIKEWQKALNKGKRK